MPLRFTGPNPGGNGEDAAHALPEGLRIGARLQRRLGRHVTARLELDSARAVAASASAASSSGSSGSSSSPAASDISSAARGAVDELEAADSWDSRAAWLLSLGSSLADVPPLYACHLVGVHAHVPFGKRARVDADVALNVPTKALKLSCQASYGQHSVGATVTSEKEVASVSGATGGAIRGRQFSIEPHHNFITGESALTISSDISRRSSPSFCAFKALQPSDASAAPEAKSSASVELQRNKEGDVGARLSLLHSFNEGRDRLEPSVHIENVNKSKLQRKLSLRYAWEHRFHSGLRVRGEFDESARSGKLEASDASTAGGHWVATALVPFKRPSDGLLSIRRDFEL
eukprot:GHVT01088051.1.p1 GENE.GHVT01088051.1~~GHVT01088051.1.p1  ORF type:complete len:347 (+),score=96.89 GHVT01088051.1:261-1301(+)